MYFLASVVGVFSLVAAAASSSSFYSKNLVHVNPYITSQTLAVDYPSFRTNIYRVRGFYDFVRELVWVEGDSKIRGLLYLIEVEDGNVHIVPVHVERMSRFHLRDRVERRQPRPLPPSQTLYLLGSEHREQMNFNRFVERGYCRNRISLDAVVHDFLLYIRDRCVSHDLGVFRERRLKAVSFLIILFQLLYRLHTNYPYTEYHIIPDNVYGWISYTFAALFVYLLYIEYQENQINL